VSDAHETSPMNVPHSDSECPSVQPAGHVTHRAGRVYPVSQDPII